ncbi:MAG: hypothetical protein E7241_06245 [Lachnospiraceae bacterium]|nr:hypothetical protein [Lachnospiraceae bacterium]
MKKKVLSLLLTVAMLVTALPMAVFAADSPEAHLAKVKAEMEQTADAAAGYFLENTPDITGYVSSDEAYERLEDYITDYAVPLYFINKSGYTSDKVTESNNKYMAWLKLYLQKRESKDSHPLICSLDFHCQIIMAVLSMGQDPTHITCTEKTYDLVGMMVTAIESGTYSVSHSSRSHFYLSYVEAVYRLYKGKYPSIAADYKNLTSAVMSKFIKNSALSSSVVDLTEINDPTIREILGHYPETDCKILNSGKVCINQNTDAILAELNASQSKYAGKFAVSNKRLVINDTIKYTGFIGFGEQPVAFTESMAILPLVNANVQTAYPTGEFEAVPNTVTPKEAIDNAFNIIHKGMDNNGLVKDFYPDDGVILTSTANSLVAASVFNRPGDAKKLYEGMNTFRQDGGRYLAKSEQFTADEQTMQCNVALVSYYYSLSGLGNVFDLTIKDTTVDPNRKLEMKSATTHNVVMGSGESISFRSPANYASFQMVYIDGKAAIAPNPTSVDSNGASTFAGIGGGSLRVETGSTIVTLSPEYLATLSPGSHTIRIQSANGYAEDTFVMTTASKVPISGDGAQILLYVLLLMAGFAAMVIMRKRAIK